MKDEAADDHVFRLLIENVRWNEFGGEFYFWKFELNIHWLAVPKDFDFDLVTSPMTAG